MTWKEISNRESIVPPTRRKDGSGYGTVGRKIPLIANHFEVKVANKNIDISHYDVKILNRGSSLIPKWKKKFIFERMKEQFPKVFTDKQPIAYDSESSAYSVGLIPQLKNGQTYKVDVTFDQLTEGSVVGIKDGGYGAISTPLRTGRSDPPGAAALPEPAPTKGKKGKKQKQVDPLQSETSNRNEYVINITLVNRENIRVLMESLKYGQNKENFQTPMQMVEVMFRHYRARKFVQVGRNSFFSLKQEFGPDNDIGFSKIGMTGFFASLRPAEWKDGSLLLNVDKAHAVFHKKQLVLDFIMEKLYNIDLRYSLDQRNLRIIDKELSKIKVRATHTMIKRTYRVNGVTPQGADRLTFDLDQDGVKKKTTVADYFQKTYNCRLRFPGLNCLHVGNPQRNVYIPMEVCEIVEGQRVTKKLSDKETANFIRSTARPPAERLRSIMNAVRTNNFSQDPNLKALTFSIDDNPIKTNGRVLPAPSLTMERQVTPRNGVWDVRGQRFNKAAALRSWVAVNYDPRTYPDSIGRFVDSLIRIGRDMGMAIERPKETIKGVNPLKDFGYLKEKYPDLELIFCVLPFGELGTSRYSEIKTAGDLELQVVSQCIKSMNVQKAAPATISNLLLKINAKLGGTNNIVGTSSIDLIDFKEAFMIMGADVNHPPSKGDQSMPSIAAVVASYDAYATKYKVEVRSQAHRVEIIQDLTEITVNMLRNFYKQTGYKPTRIVMYRDGVSESQFSEVLSKEMLKIRDACTRLSKSYTPGITFICVQKRHHTRLFCENERDGVGKAGNVPPGTVLDHSITHPSENDFYLCSHQGIQGTSRPTHYHVLWDDNDLNMNQLQKLTYVLCHVYSRCTRSVSIPTPAYYAHLAAFRAKVYVGDMFEGDSISSISDRDFATNQSIIRERTRISSDKTISNRLFYV